MKNKIEQLYAKTSSSKYIEFLKKKGVKIGKGTVFFYPYNSFVDLTRPWLIEIGNNVQITKNVSILTHGYDWAVLKGIYGNILGSSGKVTIKNNVFIGFNTTILKGVTVGNNVIIGANSLINKDVPDNVVVAGNPAKVIMTIEEYYKKRIKEQNREATELAIEYYKKYNKWPNEKVLREFLFLFKDRTSNFEEDEVFMEITNLVGNYKKTKEYFINNEGLYKNYDEFIEYCKKQIN